MEKVRFGFIGAGLIAKIGLYPALTTLHSVKFMQ